MQLDIDIIPILATAAAVCFMLYAASRVARQFRQNRSSAKAAPAPAPPPAPAPSAGKTQKQAASGPIPVYQPIRTLLTDAEQQFFRVLQLAAPTGLVICPQVRLANLVAPATKNQEQHKYDFYRIQAKCVDFVLCDIQTTAPRLVIELDDASHKLESRQQRDTFVDTVLAQVGLPILHIPWQQSYNQREIASAIAQTLGVRQHASEPIARPIAAVAGSTALAQAVGAPPAQFSTAQPANAHGFLYVCGKCQGTIQREAKHCPHCGTLL